MRLSTVQNIRLFSHFSWEREGKNSTDTHCNELIPGGYGRTTTTNDKQWHPTVRSVYIEAVRRWLSRPQCQAGMTPPLIIPVRSEDCMLSAPTSDKLPALPVSIHQQKSTGHQYQLPPHGSPSAPILHPSCRHFVCCKPASSLLWSFFLPRWKKKEGQDTTPFSLLLLRPHSLHLCCVERLDRLNTEKRCWCS